MRRTGQTLIEKIAQRHAVGITSCVRAGDFVTIEPHRCMSHDNAGAVMAKFASMNVPAVCNPGQIVFTLDHNVQDRGDANLRKYRNIEAFAQQHGIDFHPAGRGIGHQVMIEEGHVLPGKMVVASDSHSNMYGGLGCLGTPVVRTDAASIWATGRTWWQVPPTARVNLTGALPPGSTSKDLIIMLCGHFCEDEVLNHAIEFVGDGVASLSIEDRLTVANMSTEWGALAGVFPADERTFEWLYERSGFLSQRGPAGVPSDTSAANTANAAGNEYEHPRLTRAVVDGIVHEARVGDSLRASDDAEYSRELAFDLSAVQPHISGPNHVKTMTSLAAIEGEKIMIQKAYIVSCVNSRASDISAAAAVLSGKQVAPGVELYVAAASSEVEAECTRRGDWQALLDAGARPLPPGCGPCVGLGAGLLRAGEVGISATNRNFKGRMGSRDAQAYLASPAVVAASAAAGYICSPATLSGALDTSATIGGRDSMATGATAGLARLVDATARRQPVYRDPSDTVQIVPGFPDKLSGTLLYCSQNDINTDGIFAGTHTCKLLWSCSNAPEASSS